MVPTASPLEPGTPASKQRVVLTVIGSLGDLHPYIALALGLQARGHEAILATGACYRPKIERLGLGFRAVRPDSDRVSDPVAMRPFLDERLGLIRVVRDWLFPVLRESYEDIRAAAAGADLLVSHPLMAYATRLVAETTGIRWASTMLVPLGFFSTYDLPVFPLPPLLSKKLRGLGPAFWGPVFGLGRRATRFLARPWYRLRAELGLPPTWEANPLSDSHSPGLVLALFSKLLADRQPDWPPQSIVTGFPLYDRDGPAGLPPALVRFLDEGPPPLVFTLGTVLAIDAGAFYEHAATAARRLGRRAVLILKESRNRPATLPAGVVAFDYAPFSELFPRAAAVVHHGGVGTTGLAMRAGRPMLVLPRSWDQPDNAERVTRLGIARNLPLRCAIPARLAAELEHLLGEPAYSRRAAEVGRQVRQENGVATACDALERFLVTLQPHGPVPPTS